MRVFVDTNVLLDFICKREPFFDSAKGIFAACFLKKIDIVISALSIVNSIYIGRKYGSDIIKAKLLSLSQFYTVADLPSETVLKILKSDWADYEDALQYATVKEHNADCIVTRNTKDFEKSEISVYLPEEILGRL